MEIESKFLSYLFSRETTRNAFARRKQYVTVSTSHGAAAETVPTSSCSRQYWNIFAMQSETHHVMLVKCPNGHGSESDLSLSWNRRVLIGAKLPRRHADKTSVLVLRYDGVNAVRKVGSQTRADTSFGPLRPPGMPKLHSHMIVFVPAPYSG